MTIDVHGAFADEPVVDERLRDAEQPLELRFNRDAGEAGRCRAPRRPPPTTNWAAGMIGVSTLSTNGRDTPVGRLCITRWTL